jgi:hypothetical protein
MKIITLILALLAGTVSAQTNNVMPWLAPQAVDSTFNRAATWYAKQGVQKWTLGQTAPVPTTNQLAAISKVDITRWVNGGRWSNNVAYVRTGTQVATVITDRSTSTRQVGPYTEAWVYGAEWWFRNLLSQYGCNPDDSFDINLPKLQDYAHTVTNQVTFNGVVLDGVQMVALYGRLGALGSDFTGARYRTNQVPVAVYTEFR